MVHRKTNHLKAIKELNKFDVPLYFATGKMTYDFRLANNIPKDHHFDATCIAFDSPLLGLGVNLTNRYFGYISK